MSKLHSSPVAVAPYVAEPDDSVVRATVHDDGLVLENPHQTLKDDVVRALDARRAAHLQGLAIAQEPDATPAMKQRASVLRRRVARPMETAGGDFERLDADLREFAITRSDQISEAIRDRIARRQQLITSKPPKWGEGVVAQPVDHSFWWARTRPHLAPGTQAGFRDDGLHFWGGPKVNDYDGEMHTSFGAVAAFALQPARFPTSPSGLFLSSPHVELFGGVVAYAPDWDLIQGNGIAECKLFLRQTIFQLGFGQSGPQAITLGEAQGYDAWRIYLKNTGYSRNAAMPGFKLMPPVTYYQGQIIPTGELWAELEVRLDIYLNCTGALVWCDPDVLLRNFQWAPTPLP